MQSFDYNGNGTQIGVKLVGVRNPSSPLQYVHTLLNVVDHDLRKVLSNWNENKLKLTNF